MEFANNIRDWWKSIGGATRAIVLGLLVCAAVAVGVFLYLSPSEPMVAVGPDMPLDEVKAVRDRLNTLNIPNELDSRGVNVLVPASRRAEAAVGLAAEGLPTRSGKGLETFEESSFGATPFQNAVNYQRALQNELARAITQVEPVVAARVLLARPDPTPFVRDQRPAKASVVLRLRPNTSLSKGASSAIVSLVAHAVDGLKPENVTVIDQSGRMLSDPYAASKDELPGDMIDFRKALEMYLARKAQDVLSPSLGAGRVVVTVNADLNYQKVKERQKKYTPEEKVVIAERLTNMKTTGAAPARGAAGLTSNAARPGGGAGGSASGGSSQEETISTDYAFGEIVREMDDRAGAVTRLTIAAAVDLSPLPNEDGTPGGTEPIARMEDVQELIKQAIGFKDGRDEIKVANMKLTGPPVPEIKEVDEEAAKLARMQAYVSLARNISLAFAAVVGLAIIPLALLRAGRPAKPVEVPAPPPPTPEQLAAAARDRRRQQVEKLAELTRTNPDAVSDVFNLLVSK